MLKKNKLFSIIVVSLNTRSKFIKTINSIVNQKFKNYEIIVIDGGSDDGTIDEINKRDDNIIILKSTIIPGTTRKLSEEYPNLNFVFNPEFLTERTAKLDFLTRARVVLGGTKRLTKRVAKLFEERLFRTFSYTSY